jgi:ubiquinone/menaquinone biosynthesis C-methylase UbiE
MHPKALVPLPIKLKLHAARNYIGHKRRMHELFGRHASLIPPLELMHDGPVGYGEFKENAEEFFRYYTELCDLKPSDRILDVGSGIGRKTYLLTGYLKREGSYEGLDIVKTGVDWCTERITRKYPRFKFQLIDVCNKVYNPTGTHRASEYRFPFADESFDFVVLGSVFTHMLTKDMGHYLSEVARVLKKGGRCLISYFLLNEKSIGLMRGGKSAIDLHIEVDHCSIADPSAPEAATGYEEEFVLQLYQIYHLQVMRPVHYGSWCGREDFLSYQDLILAFKPLS